VKHFQWFSIRGFIYQKTWFYLPHAPCLPKDRGLLFEGFKMDQSFFKTIITQENQPKKKEYTLRASSWSRDLTREAEKCRFLLESAKTFLGSFRNCNSVKNDYNQCYTEFFLYIVGPSAKPMMLPLCQ
jgi:hypothetical protein